MVTANNIVIHDIVHIWKENKIQKHLKQIFRRVLPNCIFWCPQIFVLVHLCHIWQQGIPHCKPQFLRWNLFCLSFGLLTQKIQSLWIEKKKPSAPQNLKNTRLAQIKEKHIFNFNFFFLMEFQMDFDKFMGQMIL